MFADVQKKGPEPSDDDEADLDLDTVRASARRAVVKEDYSSGSDGEFRQSQVKRTGMEELESSTETDDLREWTRTEIKESTLEGDIQVEAFNMREEMEQGDFDRETGGYVLKRDEHVKNDSWLMGITNEQIKRAQVAEEKRIAIARANQKTIRTVLELLTELVPMVELGESPIEAIQRRKPKIGNKKFDAKSKRLAAQQTPEEKVIDEQRRNEINIITEICTLLLDQGVTDIYDMAREEIQRLVNRQK
jgi:CD2 antigen cytoplasmic tail-binding protein 2